MESEVRHRRGSAGRRCCRRSRSPRNSRARTRSGPRDRPGTRLVRGRGERAAARDPRSTAEGSDPLSRRRPRSPSRSYGGQPSRADEGIIVDKRHQLAARSCDANVAGPAQPHLWLGQVPGAVSIRQPARGPIALGVVDDDHLEAFGVELRDRVQAPLQRGRPSPGADHDRALRPLGHDRISIIANPSSNLPLDKRSLSRPPEQHGLACRRYRPRSDREARPVASCRCRSRHAIVRGPMRVCDQLHRPPARPSQVFAAGLERDLQRLLVQRHQVDVFESVKSDLETGPSQLREAVHVDRLGGVFSSRGSEVDLDLSTLARIQKTDSVGQLMNLARSSRARMKSASRSQTSSTEVRSTAAWSACHQRLPFLAPETKKVAGTRSPASVGAVISTCSGRSSSKVIEAGKRSKRRLAATASTRAPAGTSSYLRFMNPISRRRDSTSRAGDQLMSPVAPGFADRVVGDHDSRALAGEPEQLGHQRRKPEPDRLHE